MPGRRITVSDAAMSSAFGSISERSPEKLVISQVADSWKPAPGTKVIFLLSPRFSGRSCATKTKTPSSAAAMIRVLASGLRLRQHSPEIVMPAIPSECVMRSQSLSGSTETNAGRFEGFPAVDSNDSKSPFVQPDARKIGSEVATEAARDASCLKSGACVESLKMATVGQTTSAAINSPGMSCLKVNPGFTLGMITRRKDADAIMYEIKPRAIKNRFQQEGRHS